jgi:uncharacterized protein
MADRLASVPNPRIDGGWVADPAGVVSRRTPELNALLSAVERDTTAEIAVVVLPTIGDLVPKDFAVALFERWGVGKAGDDNGVLVLHILDQRRVEIETGYGMEGVLPDVKCFWITDGIGVPFFKAKSFADGHYEIVRALERGIRNPEIGHEALVGPWTTQPGAITESMPDVPTFDAIALKHASAPKRAFFNPWTPLVLLAIGIVAYLLISGWVAARSRGKSPYEKYQLFGGAFSRLQYLAAVPTAIAALAFEFTRTGTWFAPIPALLAVTFATRYRRSKVLQSLRDAPRTCECGKPMHRLSEREDDAHIQPGNVAEESIQSVDYDVWTCDVGHSRTEAYKGKTPAKACPLCNYKTLRETSNRTLRAATTSSTGLRETTNKCAHCSYSKIETHTIPRVSTSSGSSGGGSRGGGGSFGGGRSGGGGAGSSY